VVDVEEILREEGIEERAVFYGLEDIITSNPVWKIFHFIKRNTPPSLISINFLPKSSMALLTKVTM